MANFKIGRGMQDGIPETLTDGMLYYCIDTTNLFIDYTDSNGNLVRSQLSANYADKLRYVADGATVEIDPKDIALDSEVLHKNQPEQTNNIIAFIRDDDTIESPKRTYVNYNGVHVISSIGISNAGADNEYWAFNGMAIDNQGIVVRKTSCHKGDYYNSASIDSTVISNDSDGHNIVFGFGGNVALYSGSKEEGSSGTLIYTMKEDNDLDLANKQYVDTNIADSVKYSEQTLTDEQKAQARTNIGAEALGSADAALTSANTYTDEKVAGIVNSAPETLDTLNELAAALGNDENFATTVATQIGSKVDKVDGKGLSTEDFTTEEKEKLAGISTKLSGFENDVGFLTAIPNEYVTDDELTAKGYLTSYTETDPTVPDWAKQPTKPTYTADEVGALPDTTVIPTNISELNNDSGYLTSIPAEYITETELEAKGYLTSYTETDPTVPEWAKAATKPTYTADEVGALPNTTPIPTKTSDLTNDSGYLTAIPSEYITETELAAYGYLTSYTETDPTVPAWAKEENKPTYTASEVGALPADTVIPSIDGLASESYVDNAVSSKITTPTTATVGQILSVKSVDTNGSPTEWETIDYNFVT